MDNNKKIKIFAIITTILITLTLFSTCYADSEKVTKDLELNSYSSNNNKATYGCNIEKNGEIKLVLISATEFNLPSNLFDYNDNIRMRVTYTEDDLKVYDCKVINRKTGEVIEDLSEENLNKLFNIEYGKNINKKSWSKKIKLSEINENEIYEYTANSTTQFPEIENDIGKNCAIYIKENDDKTYTTKINMSKSISGNGISVSLNEYNSGEAFRIMYQTLENSELIELIGNDEIIYLSKYKDGDKLEYQFEKYIYNDTDQNIIVNTKDTAFDIEKTDSVIIGKGEIYEFDWMIDEATISYEQSKGNDGQDSKKEENDNSNINNQKTDSDSNNTNTTINQKTDNNSNNTNTTISQNKDINSNNINNSKTDDNKDSTISDSSKLPQTGTSNFIFIMILIFITIMIITAIKLRKIKDIK